MLKPKCKNRSAANRNLSIRIIREEQLNHLPFVSDFTESLRQPLVSLFSALFENGEYAFLRPSEITELEDDEAEILAEFYATLAEPRIPKRQILNNL